MSRGGGGVQGAKQQAGKDGGIVAARILTEDEVILGDVHEGWSVQRVGQVPACSCGGCEALVCGDPCDTPHAEGEWQGSGAGGRVTSLLKRSDPGRRLGGRMAKSGFLHDGEGWTPPPRPPIGCGSRHDRLPAANSDELTRAAIEGASEERAGG